MKYRKLPFHDLPSADNWLTDALLNRQSAADRLLETTRLTDLIYIGCSFEDVCYGTQRADQPVNAETLAADVFAALFSPVLRRKDTDSVNLRQRFFNKPVLDRLLSDDRFESLKSMCENKELPSYAAAASFAHSLNSALVNKPYTPQVHYLQIISMLEDQVKQTLDKLRKAKDGTAPMTAQKQMEQYKRVCAKLSQIEDLKQKLAVDALCHIQSIGDEISSAIDAAENAAEEVTCIMTAWGTDVGEMKCTPVNKDLLQRVKKSEELLRIARSLGKYREIIADKRKNGYAYGRGEKYDLTHGNDINNCLSSELALLGTPETQVLFVRKYEQKRLTQYQKRTQIVKGKGDMIVLVDESSSTRSVQAWAKAFALAMLDIASKDNRKFAMVHFANADNVKTDLFEPGRYSAEDILRAAEQFFGGGTDFEAPLTEALRLMEKGYENADITIITDGECRISNEFAEQFRNAMLKHKATVTGILLDKDSPCGKSLEPFCDKIYHSKDITEEEIARQILSNRA